MHDVHLVPRLSRKIHQQVWFRITALVAILCTLLVSYLGINYYSNLSQLNRLYESRIESQRKTFDTLLKGDADQINSLASDYTHWDDMVTFTKNNGIDHKFAQENLVPALDTYSVTNIWIYSNDLHPIYSASKQNSKITEAKDSSPLTSNEITKIFTSNGTYHFFINKSGQMYEISASSIHPSFDVARKTKSTGYFIVGRAIDKSWLSSASLSIGGEINLLEDNSGDIGTPSYDKHTGQTSFSEGITDFNHNPVGQLTVTQTAEDLKNVEISMENQLIWGFAIVAATILTAAPATIFLIIKPLRQVRRSLAKNNSAPVALLKTQPNEFGDIATMITNYFNQQDALMLQKAQVEELVLKRTQELQSEHARLQSTFDSINTGLLITYDTGTFAICNPAMTKILGLKSPNDQSPSGTIAISIDHIQKHLPGYPLADKIKECLATSQQFENLEVTVGTKSYRIIGSPIQLHQSEIIGCVVLVEDITEQKVLERSKDEFFTLASHELRTPLTTIMGNSSMLLDDYKDELTNNPDIIPIIKDMFASSQKMIGIVNNFIDLSALEQKKAEFSMSKCSLKDIIENTVNHISKSLSSSNCEVIIDYNQLTNLPLLQTDSKRIQQILGTLVDNAAAHGNATQVKINTKMQDEFVWVSVIDNGQGIPEENQKMLFHKFQQAGSSLLTRDISGGTGIELYIAKLLANGLGGDIRLDYSSPDQGTSFSFSIPL